MKLFTENSDLKTLKIKFNWAKIIFYSNFNAPVQNNFNYFHFQFECSKLLKKQEKRRRK